MAFNLLFSCAMTIKKRQNKLQLTRETLRVLGDSALDQAFGGQALPGKGLFTSLVRCNPQPQPPEGPVPQPSFGFCRGPITTGPRGPEPTPSFGFCQTI